MSRKQQLPRPSAGPDRAQSQMDELVLQDRMQNIGYKILVLSGKGGVGKSTVAANLAVALASTGKSVGLLDVAIVAWLAGGAEQQVPERAVADDDRVDVVALQDLPQPLAQRLAALE